MDLQNIQHKIYELRGHRVMLDFDLAALYDVETRVLNQAVKRNIAVFPEDFMFKISEEEWNCMSSQFVMTYPQKRPRKALPRVFTEHGVAMLANVLKSKKAREVSVAIVRAFIALKRFALNYEELAEKIKELEGGCGRQFKDVYQALNYLLEKDTKEIAQKERKRIGF